LQRLPKVLEDRLAEWGLTQEALGHSVTHAQIKVFGERLCALQDHLLLGKRSIHRFLRGILSLRPKSNSLSILYVLIALRLILLSLSSGN
jgi:hypothetical protein